MRVLLAIVGVLMLLAGLGGCVVGKTAIHEGVSAIVGVGGLMCMAAAAIIEQLERINAALKARETPAPPQK